MKKFTIFGVVMIIGAGVALATTLSVPFYRDGSTAALTSEAFIGIKTSLPTSQVVTIVYTSLNASGNPQDLTVTFALAGNSAVSWRPVADLGVEGPLGRAVPNNTIINPNGIVAIAGSAVVIGQELAGRYVQNNVSTNSSFAHALIQ